jgi:hypothetical protein
MSKSFHFKIDHPDRASLIVNAILKNENEGKNGHFSWMGLEGTFSLHDHYLDLNITEKPEVVSWSVIESNLQKFLKNIHIM